LSVSMGRSKYRTAVLVNVIASLRKREAIVKGS